MFNDTSHHLDMRPTRRLAMTNGLRQAIDFLKLDNLALARHLKTLSDANPALEVPEVPPTLGRAEASRPVTSSFAGTELTELRLAAPDASLREHVATEIAVAFRNPEDLRIAEIFAEALEPTGWLGEPLTTLALRAECGTKQAKEILARLQQIEPAGIFARDLAECLRLQVTEHGLMSAAMEVLLDHLDLLARAKIDTLAELCCTSTAEIMELVTQIRSLDPKPGLVFGPAENPIRPPDVIIHETATGGWRIELNDETAPEIKLCKEPMGTVTEEAYQASLTEARWILRAVSRRNATVLQVVRAVMASQSEFLQKGVSGLRPLTRLQVAETTKLHETTVGRVAMAMLIQTPQGTLPLRSFFGPALKHTASDAGISTGVVRQRMREHIRSEPLKAPLNDAALANLLAAEGIQVARRTIAKYRELMGIRSSRQRRARYDMARSADN